MGGLGQPGLYEEILSQKNKKTTKPKHCSQSLILISYTAVDNHMSMYSFVLALLSARGVILQPSRPGGYSDPPQTLKFWDC